MRKRFNIFKEKSKRNKKLIENFSYLSALQIFNLILPLVTYPYLLRVLGKETYGLVIFAYAIVGYLGILINFGFDISAVKDISANRDNREKLSEIVSSVTILKGLLFVLSFMLLIVVIRFIPEARNYKCLFYLAMFMSINLVLFPSWYFQGIEQMKYITYINLIGRLSFVALMLIFIHTPEDYLFHPFLNGIGSLITGLIALYIIFVKHKLKFGFQPIAVLKHHLKEAVLIFIANVSIKIYVTSNRVILGAFVGMAEVAYYDLGEKIVSILRMPQGIISQTLFPKIIRDKNVAFVKKVFRYSLILNIGIAILAIVLSKYLVTILGGGQMSQAIWVVNILVLTAPVVSMSNIFGIQLLIPFGYRRTFSTIIVISGLIYIALLSLFWLYFELTIYSMSIVTVLTELSVTLVMFLYCKKYKLW